MARSINFTAFRVVSYIAIMTALFFTDLAYADFADNTYDQLMQNWEQTTGNFRGKFRDWTRNTFYALMTIELVISAIIFAFQPGGGDIVAFAGFLVPRILIFGFFIYLFKFGFAIAYLIIKGFVESGELAVGNGFRLSPDGIIDYGLKLTREMTEKTSWWSGEKFIIGLSALFAMGLFSIIAANVLIALAEMYIVLTAGIITLALLGSSYTRDWALGYFRYTIGSGLKLLAMIVIIGVGFEAIRTFFPHGRPIEGDHVLAMISTLIVIYKLSLSVPDAAASMINGNAGGAMNYMDVRSLASSNSLSNSLKSVAGAIKGAGKTTVNTASAVGNAGKVGGGVAGGAAALGKTVAAQAGARARGDGSGAAGSSFSGQVASSLRSQAKGLK